MRYSFTVIIQVHALLNCRFQVRYCKVRDNVNTFCKYKGLKCISKRSSVFWSINWKIKSAPPVLADPPPVWKILNPNCVMYLPQGRLWDFFKRGGVWIDLFGAKMLFFEKPQRPPLDRFRPRQKAATRRCGLKMASINATVLRTVVGPVKESQVETLKFLICCDCIDNCCDQKRTKYAQVGDRTPSLIRQLAATGWDELAATTPLTTPPSFCPRTLC